MPSYITQLFKIDGFKFRKKKGKKCTFLNKVHHTYSQSNINARSCYMVGQFRNELTIKRGLYTSAINSFQPSCTSLSLSLPPLSPPPLRPVSQPGNSSREGWWWWRVPASRRAQWLRAPSSPIRGDVSYPIFWVLIK